MAEFSIIDKHFSAIGHAHEHTRLGVGDDAAIVAIPPGYELAVSTDTMCEGTHFFAGTEPELLAHKLLAVNLSDMAAMGASPKWATLAISLVDSDESWLASFANAFDQYSKAHEVQLIGGDTTQTEGCLTLSLTIMGLLPTGKRLTRSGAQPEDEVYCSGTLGDAALALSYLYDKEPQLSNTLFQQVLPALHTPEPQVALGEKIRDHASACLDISDGLLGDCAHIAKHSNVSIRIDLETLPLSPAYLAYLDQGGSIEHALSGGDDYQLLFTAPPHAAPYLRQAAAELGVTITKIGTVNPASDTPVQLFENNKEKIVKNKSYQHFS